MKSLVLCLSSIVLVAACGGDGPKAADAGAASAKPEAPKADEAKANDAKAEPPALGDMMAQQQAKGDAALARLRKHVEAGAVTADTLASVEKDRERGGMGQFAVVLDDASSLIESGRVAPGTAVEIHIHAGLGGEEPPLPPADERAADVIFDDGKTKRRVARISSLPGAMLAVDPFGTRIRNLMQWWAQDPEGHDVEIVVNLDPSEPTIAAPADLPYALLELGGVVDRPLLLFPDGSSKSIKEWLGR